MFLIKKIELLFIMQQMIAVPSEYFSVYLMANEIRSGTFESHSKHCGLNLPYLFSLRLLETDHQHRTWPLKKNNYERKNPLLLTLYYEFFSKFQV